MTEKTNSNGSRHYGPPVSISKTLVPRRIYFRRAAKENAAPTPAASQAEPSGPSSLGRELSRKVRIGLLRGEADQAVKDAHNLMEAWHEEQHASVRAAAARLDAVPGLSVEQVFKDAVESSLRYRANVYAKRAFFFEDSEALVAAITRYAAVLARPYDAHERARRAAANLSVLRTAGAGHKDPRVARARRAVTRGKLLHTKAAQKAQERRIKIARDAMIDAREQVEREFYVTSFGSVQTCPPHPYTAEGGQERSSDSNRVQLRPRSGPGH